MEAAELVGAELGDTGCVPCVHPVKTRATTKAKAVNSPVRTILVICVYQPPMLTGLSSKSRHL